jgi:hypothetical protein
MSPILNTLYSIALLLALVVFKLWYDRRQKARRASHELSAANTTAATRGAADRDSAAAVCNV